MVRWSVVDELTEDFLEEYGWRRLFRELAELKKCEIVVKVQSTELKANAQAVRDRMDMHRCRSRRGGVTCFSRLDLSPCTQGTGHIHNKCAQRPGSVSAQGAGPDDGEPSRCVCVPMGVWAHDSYVVTARCR